MRFRGTVALDADRLNSGTSRQLETGTTWSKPGCGRVELHSRSRRVGHNATVPIAETNQQFTEANRVNRHRGPSVRGPRAPPDSQGPCTDDRDPQPGSQQEPGTQPERTARPSVRVPKSHRSALTGENALPAPGA